MHLTIYFLWHHIQSSIHNTTKPEMLDVYWINSNNVSCCKRSYKLFKFDLIKWDLSRPTFSKVCCIPDYEYFICNLSKMDCFDYTIFMSKFLAQKRGYYSSCQIVFIWNIATDCWSISLEISYKFQHKKCCYCSKHTVVW